MDILTDVFVQLLVLSLLTEAITERIKDLFPHKLPSWVISTVIGIGVAVYWGVDLTRALDQRIDIVGSILTGFLAARGSNWVNDITAKLQRFKQPPIKDEL